VNFDLLGKDVVSDLLPVLAVVGALAEHAFVGDHTHGEVIDSDAVILPAHDLRRHVAWRPRRVFGVLGVP